MGNVALGSEKSLIILGVRNSISEQNIHHKVSQSLFHHSGHRPVRRDPIFEEPHGIPSNLNSKVLTDPRKSLENIGQKIG